MEHLKLNLHFTSTPRVEELRDRHCGKFPWLRSRRGNLVIAELAYIDGATMVSVPRELMEANPLIVFGFQEYLRDYLVEICTGLSGKPLHPYFKGGGLLDDGACFSVPNSIVVVSALLQGELAPLTIRQFKARHVRGCGIKVDEEPLLNGGFKLPPELHRFELPASLAQSFVLGKCYHQPLYEDERDDFLTGCFGRKVEIYCQSCQKTHMISVESLLEDREMRLLLVRNYGNGNRGTLDGDLKPSFCPNKKVELS